MRRSVTNRKADSLLPLIAAILMTLKLIGHIASIVDARTMFFIDDFAWMLMNFGFHLYEGVIFNIIIFLLFVVSLFTKNRRLMLLPSVLGFLSLIVPAIVGGFPSSLNSFLMTVAAWFIFMLFCILFALYPQNMKNMRKLWFIPGAVLAIALAFDFFIEDSYLRYLMDNSFWDALHGIASEIVMIVSLLIMTRWLTDSREENLRAIAHTAVVAGSTGQKIEKLVSLKKLLDMGALTQDEFDEKKKQVLG